MSNKINEPKGLTNVAEFHEAFGLPVLDQPAIPKDRIALRINLLQEELNELKEALDNNDLVETADALADLQYVLSGAILEFGMRHKMNPLFEEVHRSNMSKICKTQEEAEATQKHYKETKDTDSYIVEKEGQFFVYREGDNKVLKSIKYSPADISGILNA